MDRKTKPPDLFSQREELSVNLKNGKMMSKVLLYLLMITCMLTRVSSTEVKWKVLDTSPKLGQNLTLFCKVDNCTVDGIKRWYGGPDVKPLMSNSGISTDKRKYNTSIEKNGFILTILNLTVKDLNVSYECSCGFDLDNHILYIEDVYRVDNLNKSTNGTNYVGTINADWGVIIGYIAIPVIPLILLLIVIVIKRRWLWRKLKEKIYGPRRRNTDLDDNLHGSQLLQHPQELIKRVTDEVDGQSVIDPLVQTTPVDSNPRQSSDKLSEQVLAYVASNLGIDWTHVAIKLGYTLQQIEQIKLDNPGQTKTQITVALIRWRNSQNSQDTIQLLIEALEFAERQDIIDDLRENYKIYKT